MSARACIAVTCVVIIGCAGGCSLKNLEARSFHSATPTDDTPSSARARYAPTDPSSIGIVAGRDDERDYEILGVVSGGVSEGIGSTRLTQVDELRIAAASLGADDVIDVHVVGNALAGLAAKRRAGAGAGAGASAGAGAGASAGASAGAGP